MRAPHTKEFARSLLVGVAVAIAVPAVALNAAPDGSQSTATPSQNNAPSSAAPAGNPAVRPMGPGVDPPRLVSKVDPQITEQARLNGPINAIVLVNLIVDPSGMPQNVRVLRGPGMGLNESAVAAVKQYRFKPAMKDGKPIPVVLNVEVSFEIYDRAQMPRILHSEKLEPTDEARQAHASGSVVLGFTIDVLGNPENIHVARGFGMGMDERAIETLKQYRFKPYQDEHGQPAARDTTLELKFKAK